VHDEYAAARAEIAELLPLRERLVRRAAELRQQLARAEGDRHERIATRVLRCDRVVSLLDNRIRLAAERLVRAA
jgi:hypothetical protein